MTNPHEPSYYEIALTNRQVVVAFVLLLACLLTAFFSGVWVGRGGAARAGTDSLAQVSPPQRTEGAAMEELQFFDRDKAPRGKGEAQREDKGEEANAGDGRPTTLQEDLSRRGNPPAASEPQAPVPAAPVPTEPAARVEPPVVLPPVAPVPRTAPPPVVPVGHGAAPSSDRAGHAADRAADRGDAEPAAGSTVIQVFATPDRQEAARVRNRLQSGGQAKAYLSPVSVGGRTMFRVRIGPFGSKEDAQRTAEVVRKTFKLDTWVTQ